MKNFSSKMRESYPRSSRQGTITRVLIVFCIALIVLYISGSVIGAVFSYAAKPLYAIRTYLSESTAVLPVYLRSRNELSREIAGLKEQISALSGSEATIARLAHENDELRALVDGKGTERIVAGVIARPPTVPYDVLVLDRGSDDGIIQDAVVYQAHDRALGFVSTVFPKSAIVTLFSSPGVESSVFVFGPDIFTTAYGEGGGVIKISVPQGVVIKEGDIAILPSLEPGILGIVRSVQSAATQPEQYGFLTQESPMQSLRLVTVGARVVEVPTASEIKERISHARSDLFTVDLSQTIDGFHASTSSTTPRAATNSPPGT